MIRRALIAVLGAISLLAAGLGVARAGGDPSVRRLPPPEVAYRDPTYVAPVVVAPPPPIPVARVPRSLNLPLYNEPPRRF